MAFNGSTGNQYKNLVLTITSEWLDLEQGTINQDQFDSSEKSGVSMILRKTTLTGNEVAIANVSGVVKPNIGPLARLELKLKLSGEQDWDTIEGDEYVSSPTIYGVFPEVNVTGLSDGRKFILL